MLFVSVAIKQVMLTSENKKTIIKSWSFFIVFHRAARIFNLLAQWSGLVPELWFLGKDKILEL